MRSPFGTTSALCLVMMLSITGCLTPARTGRAHDTATSRATERGTAPDINTKLAGNAIFQASVPDLELPDCEFHWDSHGQVYDEDLKQYIRDEFACMQKTWQTPMSSAGFADLRSVLNFPRSYPYATTCSQNVRKTPTVCLDDNIYFQIHDANYADGAGAVDMYATLGDIGLAFTLWMSTRTTMLDGESIAENQAGRGSTKANELGRRLLAVQMCFAGMYVGLKANDEPSAEGRDFFRGFIDYMKEEVDTADHGSATIPSSQHMFDWFRTGVGTKKIADCNVWKAPADSVS